MKKLLTTAVAGLIFVGTANAQGTWYTDYSTWLAQMTSIGGTATYDSLTPGLQASGTYSESGVSLTNNSLSTNLWSIAGGYISCWKCVWWSFSCNRSKRQPYRCFTVIQHI